MDKSSLRLETTPVALFASRKGSMHVRGKARREKLLAAARTLLADHPLDSISLADVAKAANVPVGSAYYFYADIRDLYAALLGPIESHLLREHEKPISERVRSWAHIIEILVKRGVEAYARDPAARQLLVGPKSPPELKLQDRRSDISLGALYESQVDAHFQLPRIDGRSKIFFRAVEVIDLMFCLSMVESGRITEEYTEEAIRAAVGYLRFYLPARLRRRSS